MNNGRDVLWQEYYAAVKAGNADRAKLILKKLHSGPSGAAAATHHPSGNVVRGGCKRCKRSM